MKRCLRAKRVTFFGQKRIEDGRGRKVVRRNKTGTGLTEVGYKAKQAVDGDFQMSPASVKWDALTPGWKMWIQEGWGIR